MRLVCFPVHMNGPYLLHENISLVQKRYNPHIR